MFIGRDAVGMVGRLEVWLCISQRTGVRRKTARSSGEHQGQTENVWNVDLALYGLFKQELGNKKDINDCC